VYVDARVPDSPRLRTDAALRLFEPGAFASHASAARLHGVPIPALPDEHVSVVSADDRRANPGVRCHVAHPTARVTVRDGVRVSAHAQMFVELATLLSLVDLVVVGDHLVRRGQVTTVTSWSSARAVDCPGRGRRASPRRTCAHGWTPRWRPGSGC
jgi:hypothetical protein